MANLIQILIATQNRGKVIEIEELLRDLPLRLLSLSDFPGVISVPETGTTFMENAVLKAVGYARQTGVMTLADDSGLEVDALGGAPGVYSARYGGTGATDAGKIDKLLKALSATTSRAERTARFVSMIAIANAAGDVLNTSTGICEGVIELTPRGTFGFGYDPVFVPDGFELSFGQLSSDIKNRISHRAQALTSAHEFLEHRIKTLTSAANGQ